jgi:4-hydroxy-4-methyl-2-oxoglutarate aldolase
MPTSLNAGADHNSPASPIDFVALLDYGTATLHEVATEGSVFPSEIRPVFRGAELCGPAFTVDTGAGHNLWIHRSLYEAPAGSVLVVSCGEEYEYGYWGEILSTAAQACGLAGVVIDGDVRDSIPIARVGFPVFARGLCVRGTGKRIDLGSGLGRPVRVGTVVVNSGDLVLGDADGVISIPPASCVGLLQGAAERTSKEERVLDGLRAGRRSVDLLKLEASGPS